MEARWHIDLLGGLRVRGSGREIARFRTQKTGALLAYLAYYRRRPHPREELITLLWPDCDPPVARNRLSKALSWLRDQLEPPDVPPGSVLMADRAAVRLNPEVVTTDVAAFATALRAAARAASDAERRASLARAADLYRGELLLGYHEDWVLGERSRLAERYFQALGQLIPLLEGVGDLKRALAYARRAVRADPLREETHRDLMRVLAAAGQPEAALRQYRELERLVKQELGAEPSAATQVLVRDIEQRGEKAVPFHVAPAAHAANQAARGEQPSVPPAHARLPALLTRFFGREEEIARLRTMLLDEQRRLVTLTGPGGSGKTRLALELAHQLREPFAGAVWSVPLQDLTDPNLILDKALDALRLPRSPHLPPLEQLAAFLADRPALLLLDNFEHLVAEGAFLVQTLLERTGQLTVLATSRQRLGLPGEREFPVLPLTFPHEADPLERLTRCESVRLLVDRVQAVRPDFQVTEVNAPDVAALCRQLEGLPLALELAATRAAVLTPAQILARLAPRFDFLANRGPVTHPRHRSLRATLDWSYELLSPELQRFFARLSVFRGGWTLSAAETVCEEPLALERLDALRSCSLVLAEESRAEMRYRLLETLREYGAEQLPPGEREGLARRHAQFFLALAEETELKPRLTARDVWMNQFEEEHDNLRAALEWSLAEPGTRDGEEQGVRRTRPNRDDAELGLRLVGALSLFWFDRGYWREGRRWLETALARTEASGQTQPRARALLGLGRLACHQEDPPVARPALEESLMISRGMGDHTTAWYSLLNLAIVARIQGNAETSRSLAAESLALCRQVGDRLGAAMSLGIMGGTELAFGELEAARSLYEESLEAHEEIEDRAVHAGLLAGLGEVARRQGDYERAVQLYREVLSLSGKGVNTASLVLALEGLAWVTGARGQTRQAVRLWSAVASLRDAIGSPRQPADLAAPEAHRRHLAAIRAAQRACTAARSIPARAYRRQMAAIRAALGDEAFAAAWAEGQAMTLQQAVCLALVVGEIPTSGRQGSSGNP